MDNSQRQNDEIEALGAIYGDDFHVLDSTNKVYSIVVHGNQPRRDVTLQVTLPEMYPIESPPIYEVQAPWLKGATRREMYDSLEEIYLNNIGEDIIFMWIEKIREFLMTFSEPETIETTSSGSPDSSTNLPEIVAHDVDCPTIFHGEPIIDRKSTFQGHVATVSTMKDVDIVKNTLMQCRKIAHATHNISAYRFMGKNGIIVQDCDDDGETAAGGRLLHLLNILNVENIVVVVSRWYGGVHLGPDRFKHINNAARNTLETNGFLKDRKEK